MLFCPEAMVRINREARKEHEDLKIFFVGLAAFAVQNDCRFSVSSW